MKKHRIPRLLGDIFTIAAGSVLYAASLNIFFVPNRIAPGGASGLATLAHELFGVPVGLGVLAINLPLFLLGYRYLGRRFVGKTILAPLFMSVTIDITAAFLPRFTGDMPLAALYGGVIGGTGLALVFMRGATTGGSDLAARLLGIRFPHVPMGHMILSLDLFVILGAALAYRQVESALWTLIALFVSSQLIDRILSGADTGKMLTIMSGRSGEIAARILEDVRRGVTFLKATGAYTGADQEVLLCAVRRQEVFRVRAIIRETDPDAFVVISEAGEIIGEGFKPLHDPLLNRKPSKKRRE